MTQLASGTNQMEKKMPRFRMKRKIGDDLVGKHRMMIDGKLRVVRPGDIIECEKSRLAGVLDKFEQLDPETETSDLKPNAGLKAVKRPGGNFTGYDVINTATGKAINSEPLKKAEAQALVEQGIGDGGDGDDSSGGDSDSDDSSGGQGDGDDSDSDSSSDEG